MSEFRLPGLSADDEHSAMAVFEFVQFLLDDEANLTPAGNLTTAAKTKLRIRIDEVMPLEEGSGNKDLGIDLSDLGLSGMEGL